MSVTNQPSSHVPEGATAGDDYFAERSLKKGAAGWVLLAGLGVAYVISGDFAGWNNGLTTGGFGGLLVAFVLMAIMYVTMVLGLAEMSSALPTAGAGYGFARRAMGRVGGFATGAAIFIEYAIAPAAICTFIGDYVIGFFPADKQLTLEHWRWAIYLFFYLVFMCIHIFGVGEALRLMFIITVIAVVALLVFVCGVAGGFDAHNLTNITGLFAGGHVPAGANHMFPFGMSGTISSLIFGIWFFLAIEGVPLAAEETKDPKRDLPRGIIVGVLILCITGLAVLFLGTGASNPGQLGPEGAPLLTALHNVHAPVWILDFVNIAGLAGLIASFFSIIFAYSRQTFALSRAGYLPQWLSLTSKRKTPVWAIIVPGAIGYLLAVVLSSRYDYALALKDAVAAGNPPGATLIDIAVFGATVSYVLMNLSHIILRTREPDLERGYHTPGGRITTGIAFVLSLVAVFAVFNYDWKSALISLCVFAVIMLYYALYSRHHLVANAPEEEFALIASATDDLN